MTFNFTVTSDPSLAAVSIAILVNPAKLASVNHSIYNNIWPVIWKVYQFPGKGVEGPTPKPISDTYSSTQYAFVGSMVAVKPAASIAIPQNKILGVSPDARGKTTCAPLPGKTSDVISLSISNQTKQGQLLGLADASGCPYVAVNVKSTAREDFTNCVEFALIVVGATAKAGDVFKGKEKMTSSFVTFLANDVKDPTLRIQYTGSKFTVDGVTVTTHSLDEQPFAV